MMFLGDKKAGPFPTIPEWARQRSFAVGLCFLIVITGFVLVLPLIAPTSSVVINSASISPDSGYAFIATPNLTSSFPFEIVSDGLGYTGSDLQLFEDHHLLGPAHSVHESIRREGMGRYSYWRQSLWFSTSDNTDPRTNGRQYEANAKAQLSPSAIGTVLALDLAFSTLFFRRMSELLYRHARKLGWIIALLTVGGAILIATGGFGQITLSIAGPANSALVVDTLRHSFLGCLLTVLQWTAGAGLALWITRDNRAPLGRIALLGFPLSLILLTLLVVISLVFSHGIFVAGAILAACLCPLAWWRPEPNDLIKAAKVIVAILPLSVIFGCWLGLLAHGPTKDLFGRPSGDVVFYASDISALQLHHFPVWYLGNEGEQYLPFNMLFAGIGTALLPYLRLDPFLFILAAGGSTYVLSLGIAIFSYSSTCANYRPDPFSLAIAALGVIVAGRYPYWTVESIPVVFILPLTIAVWYRVRELTAPSSTISNFGLAVIGALVTKVTAAATIVPLSLTPVVGRIGGLSKGTLITGAVVMAIATVAALGVVIQLGPTMLEAARIGPEGYTNWQYGLTFDWPFLLRDFGSVLLIALAWRLASWPTASCLTLGLVLALGFSFFMRINFACVAVVLGLQLASVKTRVSDQWLALTAFGLCAPAMLLTDFGGYPSGFFWLLCVGGATWIVLANAAPPSGSAGTFAGFGPTLSFRSAAIVSFAAALCLAAVARGHVVLDPSEHNSDLQISPDVRDIWLAVRERTPRDTLVFTDQTGPDPSLLTGWNTFALTGERQVYLAGWYQSLDLRISPGKRAERLALNGEVLSGRLKPTDLKYSRSYESYFAVVQRNRTMPSSWKQLYANSGYALYRYEP